MLFLFVEVLVAYFLYRRVNIRIDQLETRLNMLDRSGV